MASHLGNLPVLKIPFPECQTQIEHLAIVNPDFRDVCGDYEDVIQALDRWRQTSSPNAARMIKAFERLVRVVEIEAPEYLYKDFDQGKRTEP